MTSMASLFLICRQSRASQVTISVNGLAGYHTPNSASGFLHIALAAWVYR